MGATKRCTACGQDKPVSVFDSTSWARYRRFCRPCLAKAKRTGGCLYGNDKWQAARLEAGRLKAQGGRCAICLQKPELWSSLVTDHDHTTGRIRGMLCTRCNPGLGYFNDSPEALRTAPPDHPGRRFFTRPESLLAAADYLERAQ